MDPVEVIALMHKLGDQPSYTTLLNAAALACLWRGMSDEETRDAISFAYSLVETQARKDTDHERTDRAAD